MATQIMEVESYAIYHFLSQPEYDALIVLICPQRPGIGYRIFFSPDRDEPSFSPSGEGLIIFLPSSRYQRTVDLLRNEGPLYLQVYPTGVTLSTRSEPVGEGELQP